MLAPDHRYITIDDAEIHTEWGDPDATTLVCVHGLSRTGRDFDPLARALADRVEALVLVDVGPNAADDESAEAGIDRIVEYLTDPPTFDRFTGLEAYFRDVYDTFSPMSDAEWRALARTSARRTEDGAFTPNYDTRIVEPLLDADGDADQWALFDAIDQPVMVVRGEHSDVSPTRRSGRCASANPGWRRSPSTVGTLPR